MLFIIYNMASPAMSSRLNGQPPYYRYQHSTAYHLRERLERHLRRAHIPVYTVHPAQPSSINSHSVSLSAVFLFTFLFTPGYYCFPLLDAVVSIFVICNNFVAHIPSSDPT